MSTFPPFTTVIAPPPTFVFDVPVIDIVVDVALKLLGELNDIVELFILTVLDLLVKFTVLPPDTIDDFILYKKIARNT